MRLMCLPISAETAMLTFVRWQALERSAKAATDTSDTVGPWVGMLDIVGIGYGCGDGAEVVGVSLGASVNVGAVVGPGVGATVGTNVGLGKHTELM